MQMDAVCKKKRFKSVMILLITAIVINASAFAQEPKSAQSSASRVSELFSADFENGNVGYSGAMGTVATVKDDNSLYGNVLEISSVGTSSGAFFVFDRAADSGKLAISYDMKYAQKNAEGYVRVFKNAYTSLEGNAVSDLAEAFIIRNTGNFQKFNNMTWDVNNAPPMAYDADKWYHMDMWFDFEKRTASYYVDGEPLGETKMADKIDKIQSFYQVMTGGGKCYLDNIHAVSFTGGGIDMSDYGFIKYYPTEVEQKIVTEFNMPELGNIFFTDEISGTVSLKETMGEKFGGKVVVNMTDETGKTVSCENEVNLAANEVQNVEFKLKASRYGYYNLEARCIKSDDSIYGRAKTRASRIVLNEKSNPLIGYCTHISKGFQGYGFDNRDAKIRLAKNVGADTMRDELRWTDVEGTPGVLKYNKWAEGARETFKNSGMRFYCILGYGLPAVYPNESFPVSTEQINDFMEYVEYIAETTKDMNIDFEFWNELNMHTNPLTKKTYEPEYTHLLKLVYEKVKSINPNAKIYAMTTANVANADSWIEECLKLGAGDYLDGISIHPYNVTLSAEADKTLNDIKKVQELMKKYGIGDKKLVFSEFGWSSSLNYADEEKQANYTPEFAGLMTNQSIERILWYNFQEKTTGAQNDGELHFGAIRGWQFTEIPYEAKPVFITMAAYNKLMNGAVRTKDIKLSDERASIYAFDLPDGQKALMAWTKSGSISTALNIGTDIVNIYDRYGNKEKLYPTNGTIDVTLTENPIYIIGNLDIENIKEESPKFEIFTSQLNCVKGDYAKITGKLPKGEWDVETECPDNIKQNGKVAVKADGSFELNFKAGLSGAEKETVKVLIKNKSTGNIVYSKPITVEHRYSLSAEESINYYRNSRWQLILRLQNNKTEGNISGRVKITQPSEMELNDKEARFESLAPNEVRYMYLNIPISKSTDKLDISGYIETDGGEQIPFNDSSYFVGMTKVQGEPKIDGKIDKGEYSMETPIRMNKANMVQQISDWGGTSDLSGTVYLNYDKDYFYLAARVKDNIEGATESANKIYANDSIQFAFAERAESSAGRTEIGIGKDKDGKPSMYRYSFLGTKFFAGDFDEAIAFDDRCELEIGREGDTTIYELKMPWVDIYGDDGATFAKRNVLFCILINDNDGNGRRGWIELCPGIGGVKNAAQFMKVPVIQ